MQSTVVNLSESDLRAAADNTDKQKVYYTYVNDSVEKNMPPDEVSGMLVTLRARFAQELRADPGFSVAALKETLRQDPRVDRFAAEHPRIFDSVLSRYSTDRDIEMIQTMIKFRAAVNDGHIPESHAKAALNELLLKHNARAQNTDREKMADDRINRKVQEASFLGFDPDSIPELKRNAAALNIPLP